MIKVGEFFKYDGSNLTDGNVTVYTNGVKILSSKTLRIGDLDYIQSQLPGSFSFVQFLSPPPQPASISFVAVADYLAKIGFQVGSKAFPTGTPVIQAAPTNSGTPGVGEILTAAGTFDANGSSTTVTYQWFADASAIADEDQATYTVLAGDVGKLIYCRITATNTSGATVIFTPGKTAVA